MARRSVIYLAFANSSTQPLNTLTEEDNAIFDILNPGAIAGRYHLHRDSHAKLETLRQYLADYQNQLKLFHYAGHANCEALFLTNGIVQADGIAEMLAEQSNLMLVFLNGCSTGDQVKYLLKFGIPIVIATNRPVEDQLASQFATHFYRQLAKGNNIREAYNSAVPLVRAGGQEIEEIRGLRPEEEDPMIDGKWGMFVNVDKVPYLKKNPLKARRRVPSNIIQFFVAITLVCAFVYGGRVLWKREGEVAESSSLKNCPEGVKYTITLADFSDSKDKDFTHDVKIVLDNEFQPIDSVNTKPLGRPLDFLGEIHPDTLLKAQRESCNEGGIIAYGKVRESGVIVCKLNLVALPVPAIKNLNRIHLKNILAIDKTLVLRVDKYIIGEYEKPQIIAKFITAILRFHRSEFDEAAELLKEVLKESKLKSESLVHNCKVLLATTEVYRENYRVADSLLLEISPIERKDKTALYNGAFNKLFLNDQEGFLVYTEKYSELVGAPKDNMDSLLVINLPAIIKKINKDSLEKSNITLAEQVKEELKSGPVISNSDSSSHQAGHGLETKEKKVMASSVNEDMVSTPPKDSLGVTRSPIESEADQYLEKIPSPKDKPWIPSMMNFAGGTFQMGDSSSYNASPHMVTVSGFAMGITELTFEQYDQFCDATSREKPKDYEMGRKTRPVVGVSWEDAIEYCNWLSKEAEYTPVYDIKRSGGAIVDVEVNWKANGFRLPTEAEWEFAARGGNRTEGYTYAGSNQVAKVAWYSRSQTAPVAQLKANELGLYDMSGNVYEWCWDWYKSDYDISAQSNPHGPLSGSFRVMRGGSWGNYASYCRVAYRDHWQPSYRYVIIGFRVARTP